MATLITLPPCAQKLLDYLYPTVDWTRVGFFSGLPWYTALANSLTPSGSAPTAAITLPDPVSTGSFRVYLGSHTDFCDDNHLKLLVHEAMHVHQFMAVGGGYGPGFMRPGFIAYFTCLFQHGYEKNPFELEAGAVEYAFYARYNAPGASRICDCSSGRPEFNPLGLEWLATSPTPLPVTEAKAPSCPSWWASILAGLLVAILASLAFWGHLFDGANCALIRMSKGSCAKWGRRLRQICSAHAQQSYAHCAEWGETWREACSEWADNGYSNCGEWSTVASSSCCTWRPCSWLCSALVWAFTQVCNFTVWIANWVCVATVWIVEAVCKVFVWLTRTICIAWSYVVQVVCLLWTFTIRLILFCW